MKTPKNISARNFIFPKRDGILRAGICRAIQRILAGLVLLSPVFALAGPPFLTDDPEPVEYQHWEFYVASQHAKTSDGWAGTAPHIELNYGAIPNLQLHLIAPLSYNAPEHGAAQYGYGDTELGFKFRFIEENKYWPQVAIFPLVEAPTGSSRRGLGGGEWQAFLPVWLQKSFGEWTLYGGAGYGINPGAGNENWGFGGLVLQRDISKNILVGAEIYHRTATESGGESDTAFNVGAVVNFSDLHHLLISAGRSIDGPTEFQAYIAYQFTFGPELFQSVSATHPH
ncbi:MAG TPA: hypothetical protein VFM25_14195 [Verrucomicrobiae bacterium]|jgi:hypothetical protein|nr:hypothetical protein [Verrucomicrobiae bacterium]